MSNSDRLTRSRQWHLRPVTRLLLLALTVTVFATSAFGQAIGLRWDLGAPGSAGVTMITGGSGYPPLYAVPNATLHLCSYPAVGVPCTNYVTTYTDLTLAHSCPTNAQIVLQGSTTCQATSANDGSLGVNLAGGGTYAYTLTVNGVTSGPFTVSIGIPGTASTPVTTPVSCPSSTLFPITSESQTFAVTLTGNCAASALTAVSAIIPPASVIFQITQDASGGHTFSWPSNSIGGAQVASGIGAVTTQAFTWDGTNATAIGSANEGAGPHQVADSFDAVTGFRLNGSYGPNGYCLQSTGSGSAFAVCNGGLVLANAAVTGTVLNKLAKQTGSPSTAVITATTDTSGALGITTSGAGTTGNATISQAGKVACIFDGATTANDYVVISATAAGDCHDSGLAPPSLAPSGVQIIGQVLSTNVGAGTYDIDLYGPGHSTQPVQGTEPNLLSSDSLTGSTGTPICKSANGGATTSGCGASGINTPQRVTLGSDTGVTANTQTTLLTKSVTFPATSGTYRADIRYGTWFTAGPNACAAEVIDVTHNVAYAISGQDLNGDGYGALSASEITAATFAASSTVTFHLDVICNVGETFTKDSGLFTLSPKEVSFMQITPILSN